MDIKIENLILNLKKSLTNSINYLINKKINSLKLCEYTDNINNLKEVNKTLIKFSKNNIDLFNNKIETIENNIEKNSLKINNIEKKINDIDNKFDKILDHLENIQTHINKKSNIYNDNNVIDYQKIDTEIETKKYITTSINNDEKNFYQEFIIKDFDLDSKFVYECLHNHSMKSDIKIFKEMFLKNISKKYYPIKNIKKSFQYWKDNHMNNDDENATYIKNIISTNIANCYLKINTFENYTNDINLFVKNQDYIISISTDKYKDKILKEIIKIINH